MDGEILRIRITERMLEHGLTYVKRPKTNEAVELIMPFGVNPHHVLPERQFADATMYCDERDGNKRWFSPAELPKFTWGDEE